MALFCSETSGSQRRHIGDYFADYGCKIEGNFTDFLVGFWWLDKEKILLCFWVRISDAFAAK